MHTDRVHALVWVTGALGAVCAALCALTIVLRRRLVLLRADNEYLRGAVRHRMERPQLFSHEVRTPLALIRGAAELLLEGAPGPLTERQREFIETIADNSAQMTQLSETMLTEARIEAQLLSLHRERIEIRSLVRQTISQLRHFTRIPIELDNTGPRIVLDGDPALLRQALWNLVNNAVRHAGPGAAITVQVTTADDTVVVAVTGDGAPLLDDEADDAPHQACRHAVDRGPRQVGHVWRAGRHQGQDEPSGVDAAQDRAHDGRGLGGGRSGGGAGKGDPGALARPQAPDRQTGHQDDARNDQRGHRPPGGEDRDPAKVAQKEVSGYPGGDRRGGEPGDGAGPAGAPHQMS